MTEVARAAGLSREALYKALRPNSQPRLGPEADHAGTDRGFEAT